MDRTDFNEAIEAMCQPIDVEHAIRVCEQKDRKEALEALEFMKTHNIPPTQEIIEICRELGIEV